MAYRDLQTALHQRHEALKTERTQLDLELQKLERARERHEKVSSELHDVEEQLDEVKKHRLPMLSRVSVATPCNAEWNDMAGDERVRFCRGCQKNVYNLSALSEEEAEALVYEQEGNLCARFYRRKDGTILTSDCQVGVKRRRRRRFAFAAIGLAASAFGGYSVFAPTQATMGAIEVTRLPTPPVMGSVAVPVEAPPVR
jgi:hypothetical protein